MESKKFFVTAAICAALLGIGGTSSAAEISSDYSTLQVESQELAWGRPGPGRFQPPPQHHRRDNGPRDMRRTGGGYGGYGYDRGRYETRRETRVTVVRRSSVRI